ncbi:MAG: ATP-binding protein [Deltaproteobacteria bacterium]|nr:ATP-binding protein [Deltaproteobacteria bacterium]
MNIAIASGKGGTGKTTLTVNLSAIASEKFPVDVVDCDVEEPDSSLFLNIQKTDTEIVTIKIPEIDENACTGCGECDRFCNFNAIISFSGLAHSLPELCHSCGGCTLVCPEKAITETDRRIGEINTYISEKINILEGVLDIGVSSSPPLIRTLKGKISPEKFTFLDSPPGTSCPVVTTVTGCDYTVLVTEPTPFGLNDLILAVDMMKDVKVDFGVVINRATTGDNRVKDFCNQNGITILGEIPDDRRVAEVCSEGKILIHALPSYRKTFLEILENIQNQMEGTMQWKR